MSHLIEFIFFALISNASPHPLVGGGHFIETFKNSYFSKQGFRILATESDWQLAPIENQKEGSLISRTYVGSYQVQTGSRPQLTVRVETVSDGTTLEDYLSKWMSEFPQFGFTIQGQKNFKHVGQFGVLVDLHHAKHKRKLRQAVFLKDKKVVIMTCLDHESTFAKNLKACNALIRGFEWTQ